MKANIWFGMGGVPPHDNPLAYKLERRLHWPMIVVALLTVPAFYLEMMVAEPLANLVGKVLSWLIFLSFTGEWLVMMIACRQRLRFTLTNWLGVILVISSGAALMDAQDELIPLLRLLRIAFVGIMLMNVVRRMQHVMSPDAMPYLMFLGALLLGGAGAGFYWLEPTVNSYLDGLWLAFETGATVGYGDLVPTTPASKLFAVFIVLVGFAMMSLVTASIAAVFVGEDERKMRRLLQQDVKVLQDELTALRHQVSECQKGVTALLEAYNRQPPAGRTEER